MPERLNIQSEEIFDPVRRKRVALTPEEGVRQGVIRFLHNEKKYPYELMQVEGTITLNGMSRRCDIVVYNTAMEPRMIVECKRPDVAITQKVADQACRYNTVLRVPWLLLTNGKQTLVLKVTEKSTLQQIAELPNWGELNKIKSMQKTLTINYQEYTSEQELNTRDRELIAAAQKATESSYSPYSHFSVGAAVRLGNGNIVTGSNQENLAYPSGLCAERVALFTASAQTGKACEVEALAIAAVDSNGKAAEASPCGACRQVMIEQEQRQGKSLRTLVALGNGRVREYCSAADLLPFVFAADL